MNVTATRNGRRLTETARLALAALTVAALAGCYNPSIKEGGYVCSSKFKEECPEGFRCIQGRCWKNQMPDGSSDTPIEAPADTHVDQTTSEPAPPDKPVETAPMCLATISNCTSVTGQMCDPVCNTGCASCDQKCSVNMSGTLTCNPLAAGQVRTLGDPCTVVTSSMSDPAQSDNCGAGLVCVPTPTCGSSCFKHCRTNADCPTGSPCTRPLGGGFLFCDVPATVCNPVLKLGSTSCGSGGTLSCYLASTSDTTLCDCPFVGEGVGVDCIETRECFPGLVCLRPNGMTKSCQVVCKLTGTPSGCGVGQTCMSIAGSTTYGYCSN